MEERQRVEYFQWTEEDETRAREIVGADDVLVKKFTKEKFERESHKMWNTFYQENGDRFFRDRHYLTNEFPQLLTPNITLLEIGCGVGNAVFPLFEVNPTITVQAVDFAPSAITLVQANPLYPVHSIQAAVCDITQQSPSFPTPCDYVLMIFVLSAIAPELQRQSVLNATAALKPGGCVLLRDYGKYDLAQLRLAAHKHSKLGEDYYLKQDGTRVSYFDQGRLRDLFPDFEEVSNEYHYRIIENRKEQLQMKRVWLQACFRKLPPPLS